MNTRLHFIVEGQTEETFVNRVLVPHLSTQLIWGKARCVMTSRKRSIIYRGGLRTYAQAKKDIVLWMKEDQNPDAFFTTMFDLYALPSDFPDYDVAKMLENPLERVARLEEAMGRDINHPRFIPYLQLHEFEALLLAEPQKLEWEYPGHDRAIRNILQMVESFPSPELIDDGEETAPSKRIMSEIPEYGGMKASAGPLTAERIGLPVLREKCRHFSGWINRLEQLSHEGHP